MKVYDGEGEVALPRSPGRTNERRPVGVAEYAVVTNGATLVTSGLGSCVAVGLTDRENAAGLLHVMLPSHEGRPVENPAKFADSGIPALLTALDEASANRGELVAKIAGGSEMITFQSQERSIGDRNVDAVRQILEAEGIPLRGEDVGGDEGRSIEFSLAGELLVRTARSGQRPV